MNDQLYWIDGSGTAHERCQLLFVSTGELVPFEPGEEPYMRWPRSGWALYCRHCVDIWERIILIDSKGQQSPSTVVSVACSKHYDRWNIPGSVLAGELEYLLRHLPAAVLRREFELHIKDNNVERFSSTDSDEPAGSSTPDPIAGWRESLAGGANRNG